jgi:hypothetical protein
MTAAIPIPNRLLALLGVAVLGLLALLVVRPLLLGGSDEATTVAPTPPAHITPATTAPKPTPTPVAPAVPAVKLLDGLPTAIAGRLRHSRVVVVSVYTGTSSTDRAALAEARAGAKASGAAFTALNVLDEKTARQLQAFAGGAMGTPSTLVIRRPGRIVGRFETLADSAMIAQAAHNAGARGGK